jgi:hypothetical protein
METITQGSKGKGNGKPIKKQKVQDGTQRAWVYVTESVAPGLSSPPPFQKGKGYHDGKGKSKMGSKGKGKGKSSSFSKGKGKGKGKSKGIKGKRAPKGKSVTHGLTPGLPAFNTQTAA